MKTATVGEVQKHLARILKEIKAGQEIVVAKRGKPVARLVPVGPGETIEWPDFYQQALEVSGKPLSEIIMEEREAEETGGSCRFATCNPP